MLRLLFGVAARVFGRSLPPPRRPGRIVVTRMQHLGDAAVFLPVLGALRDAFPQARIFTLCKHPAGYELLRRCPLLDGVLRVPRGSLLDKLRLWWWMWNNPVDLFVVSTQDLGRACWALVGGARCVVGYSRVPLYGSRQKERCRFALTLDVGAARAEEREAARNMRLAEAAARRSVVPKRVEPRWWTPDEAENAARLLGGTGFETGKYLILGVGTKRPAKAWPSTRWSRLAGEVFRRRRMGCLVVGTRGESAAAREIVRDSGGVAASVAGKTGMGELLWLCAHAAGGVCVDSGVAHLIDAFDLPLVVLFGPGESAKWRPWGARSTALVAASPCAPCYNHLCPEGEPSPCMAAHEVEDVLDALTGVMEATR